MKALSSELLHHPYSSTRHILAISNVFPNTDRSRQDHIRTVEVQRVIIIRITILYQLEFVSGTPRSPCDLLHPLRLVKKNRNIKKYIGTFSR